MMYHVGKVAKVAGKRGVPSDALSYNVCIYLYYIYLYIYIYIYTLYPFWFKLQLTMFPGACH
jgi:hypothetical protein